MNWALWGPVLGTIVAGLLGMLGLVFQANKNHHAALQQINTLKDQANAATIQAEAALEAARGSKTTAEATAQAAINDTFTKAYEAADRHWAQYTEAWQRDNEDLRKQVDKNAKDIRDAELRSEADRMARVTAESNFRKAIIHIRRLIDWINEQLPGVTNYPPLPPELDIEL